MPYSTSTGRFERAPSTNARHIVENEAVKERLSEFARRDPDPDEVPIEEHIKRRDEVTTEADAPEIENIITVDGSPREIEANEEYPSTRVGYLQLAAVLFDVEEMLNQQEKKFVDPDVAKKMSKTSRHSMVLPSSNITSPGMDSVPHSWRAEIFEIFTSHQVEDRPLIEYFATILTLSEKMNEDDDVVVARCPNEDCDESDIAVPTDSSDTCPRCEATVFPTDVLRIHEKVRDLQNNEGALARFMGAVEHIIMASYLLYLRANAPEKLERTAFIYDGPLAMFEQTAWLHNPLLNVIDHVSKEQQSEGYFPPVIFGVEKSGQFADHAHRIKDEMPPSTVLGMDDDYIYDYVIASRSSSSEYGSNTYYGQRFIYKSPAEQMFVLTVPKLPLDGLPKHEPTAYPSLQRVFETIEVGSTSVTSMRENALLPIVLAHNEASIPMKTGSKVLTLFARDKLDF